MGFTSTDRPGQNVVWQSPDIQPGPRMLGAGRGVITALFHDDVNSIQFAPRPKQGVLLQCGIYL